MRRLFYWMLCLLWMFVVAVFGQPQPGHFLSSYTDNEKSCDCPMIFITDPYELQFGQSVVEAEIGSKLTLNLKLLGQSISGLMPFTDCRHAQLIYNIDDPNVFAIDENVLAVVPSGEGCTTVTLRALSEGDTKLSVSFHKHKASIYISAYSPLKVNLHNDLLLTLGGAALVSFEGGPRPWVLDNSKYSTNVVADKSDVAYASSANGQNFKVFCRNQISDSYLTLKVGNRKSVDNPFPAVATGKIRICCAVPSSLTMSSMRAAKNALPVCPAFSHSVYFKAPVTLELSALGRCVSDPEGEERPFDSIASLDVQYLSNKEIILVKELTDENKGSKLYAQAVPQGVSGLAEIEALISHFYELGSATPKQKISFPNAHFRASTKLNLVDFARPNPSSLVLWNDKSVKGVVRIVGGSGHFWIDSEAIANKLSATLHGGSGTKDSASEIEIVPKSGGVSQITLYDLCIEGSKAVIDVKVTDISGIHVDANSFVKTCSDVNVRVAILDVDGKPFSPADTGDMEISLAASPTSNDFELVLKNLVTKQVLKFPINLKLSHILPQTSTASPVVRPKAEVRPIVQEIKSKQKIPSAGVFNVREVMAGFFDAYNSFVLSTFVLLITILLFTGAYRFGIFSPFLGTTPGISRSPKLSPIQPLQTFDRPAFHSTPGNVSGNSSGSLNRFSSPSNRRSLLEEPLNSSNRSAGSVDDPYLWTTNNDLDGSGSVINRFYK